MTKYLKILSDRLDFPLITILIFFLLTHSHLTHGQIHIESFRSLTSKEGLSHNIVTSVVQDKSGFMWFGTRLGVCRFDGYNFITYQYDKADSNSLADNFVSSVEADAFGDIWIGTSNGLSRFNQSSQTFTNYYHDPSNTNSLLDNRILKVYADRSGTIWIGTYQGLSRYNRGKNSFTSFQYQYSSDPKKKFNYIKAIYEDKKGNFWLGAGKGLILFDRNSLKFKCSFDPTDPSIHPTSNVVTSIVEDDEGNLWVGAHIDGLRIFDRQTFSFKKGLPPDLQKAICSPEILSLNFDNLGTLWVATMNCGLIEYKVKSNSVLIHSADENIPNHISNKTVTSLFEDRSGVLWLGTYDGGVNKINLLRKKFKAIRYQFNSQKTFNPNSYKVILEDQNGIVWIAQAKGLEKWQKESDEWSFYPYPVIYPNINFNSVTSIVQTEDGHLWIAQNGAGLKEFNPVTRQFKQYLKPKDQINFRENAISSILLDRSKNLWFGTNSGIAQFSPSMKEFRYNRPRNYEKDFVVRNLWEDSDGIFWLSTYNEELYSFDPANSHFTKFQFRKTNTNQPYRISTIFMGRNHRLWITLQDGELLLFNTKNHSLTKPHVSRMLSKVLFESIIEDNSGNVWFGTVKSGIYRYNLSAKTLHHFDEEDGLHGDEFIKSFCTTQDGSIYMGGRSGFTFFHPDSITADPKHPKVAIVKFKVFDKERAFDTTLVDLKHDENFFSFDFAALTYSSPLKNRYKYKMEGFDNEWIDASNRRYASYTNLDPGEYIFKVIASNPDDIWSTSPATLNLKISPPIWKTNWAYGFYIFCTVFILYAARSYTIKREQLKNRLYLKSMESTKLQELDELKTRFFANISHELRTPLTLILNPAEKALNEELDQNQLKTYLKLIYNNALRLKALVNQLLDISKIEAHKMRLEFSNGDLIEFIKSIVASFQFTAKEKGIKLKLLCNRATFLTRFDRDKLEKIISNLINNALKFSREGTITVSIEVSGESPEQRTVLIKVEDQGVGIPDNKLNFIFDRFYQVDNSFSRATEGTGIGLSLTRELVQLYGGTITVESEVGKGTTFYVKIAFPDLSQARGNEERLIPDNRLESHYYDERILAPEEKEFKSDSKERSEKGSRSNGKENSETPVMLLIEDNDDLREFIRSTFANDFRVEEANNGEEGLEKALKIIPDIIICDLMMPKMDGMEFAQSFKHNLKTSHIPIIMLTARTAMDAKLEGLRIGVDDYLTKPFNTLELKMRVSNLLEQRKKLRESFGRNFSIEPETKNVSSMDQKFLKKLTETIETNLGNPDLNVEMLEKEIGMERSYLYRKLKALTNYAPVDFIKEYRMKKAADLLNQKAGNISEIAFMVGYTNMSYFSKIFRETFGTTPSRYIEKENPS
jgi:signal transduction histidine kinase/ligand-binding sensor domain-containing protein/DNA-binding response OmpR family regulator